MFYSNDGKAFFHRHYCRPATMRLQQLLLVRDDAKCNDDGGDEHAGE